MRAFLSTVGLALIVLLLVDVFKAVVLARRARGQFRITHLFYRSTWPIFATIGRRIESGQRRETFLGIYGPLSLLLLFFFWALGLILGFALVRWSATGTDASMHSFWDALYHSGASFLSVGAGDTPNGFSRWITISEAGLGFSFLALVIGYLPVFYQSFSRRELHISLLDARAGSPPSAGELIARQGNYPRQLERQLAAWEEWAADLLQDELSYPMLAYFRSQHLNQSWMGALVAITDTSALVFLSAKDELKHQAEATFAMARHALIDSSKVLGLDPHPNGIDRLTPAAFGEIRKIVKNANAALDSQLLRDEDIVRLRASYEAYADALGLHLLMAIPPWIPKDNSADNWRITSAKQPQPVFAVSDPFHEEEDERSA
ncbi:MAG: two pore domain potassium channel family protein [Candidatus Sulfotelmatobacter sp.]|nr:two pore domain potassium channel family protein [Candidatus Sulfotelmatobacter sp.]